MGRQTTENTTSTSHRTYRRHAFRVIFVLVLTAFVAIGVVFYQSNRAAVREYIRGINAAEVESSAAFLESVFYRASYAAAAIERSTVHDYLLDPGAGDQVQEEVEMRVQGFIRMFAEGNPELSSIYLYSVARNRIVTNRFAADISRFHDTDWIEALGSFEYTRPQLVFRAMPRFDSPTLSLIRTIEENDRLVGAVVVNLSISRLRAAVGRGSSQVDAALYVVQGGDRVIFSGRSADLGGAWPPTSADEGVPRHEFTAAASGNMFNLQYFRVGGESLFRDRMSRLRVTIVLLFAAIFVVGTGVAFVVTNYSYRPIREILATIEDSRGPVFRGGQEADSADTDEVQFIEDTVVGLVASNYRLEQRLSERLRLLHKTHYAALQLQINPHFLYNTLESIFWESADDHGIEGSVPRSVATLTRFLRSVLSTEGMVIPLRDEIELTRLYADLLAIRFRERVKITFEVEHGCEDTLVPKLCLQPLVENSFYHGVKPTRRSGKIIVRACRQNDALVLSVTDDGPGLSQEKLEQLRGALGAEAPSGDHVGLRNITERLQIVYGDQTTITLMNVEQGGFTVFITVPLTSRDHQLDKIVQLM